MLLRPQQVDFSGIDFDDDLDSASGTLLGLQRGCHPQSRVQGKGQLQWTPKMEHEGRVVYACCPSVLDLRLEDGHVPTF